MEGDATSIGPDEGEADQGWPVLEGDVGEGERHEAGGLTEAEVQGQAVAPDVGCANLLGLVGRRGGDGDGGGGGRGVGGGVFHDAGVGAGLAE